MTKRYKAHSVISFPVTFEDGHYERVKFLPFSYGGSVYVTSDEKMQKAIESLPAFGNGIYLDQVTGEETEKVLKEDESKAVELKRVEVNDLDEAKDYLSETFGILRSKIRSRVSILATANEHDIEFVGI